MASRFQPGVRAYDKDGRSYTVEVVDGGTVYCTASNGLETEFPESLLLTESQWTARGDGRRDISYARLKQARAYTATMEKVDRTTAEHLLMKAERLSPSVLDYTAFATAQRVLAENKDDDMIASLSIVKSREIFNESKPEIRAVLLAGVLGARLEALVSVAKVGDNVLRAMIEKGLATHGEDFEDFQDRPRR
jgi:hypothetical protein